MCVCVCVRSKMLGPDVTGGLGWLSAPCRTVTVFWPVLIGCYWIRWGEESISALRITGHLYLCV